MSEVTTNVFVATFIGSPSMNVVPAAAVGIRGERHLAGFRPEHLQLGTGDAASIDVEAAIEVVEYLGDEQLAHLRLGEHALVAKLPLAPRLVGGTRAWLTVPLDAIALFDADSGAAISEGAVPAEVVPAHGLNGVPTDGVDGLPRR